MWTEVLNKGQRGLGGIHDIPQLGRDRASTRPQLPRGSAWSPAPASSEAGTPSPVSVRPTRHAGLSTHGPLSCPPCISSAENKDEDVDGQRGRTPAPPADGGYGGGVIPSCAPGSREPEGTTPSSGKPQSSSGSLMAGLLPHLAWGG